MKKSLLVVFAGVISSIGFAQTTAQNWTKTDCSGSSHTLFTELDAGKVVLMQFDMMNCGMCTSAAYSTDQIFKNFQTSNPEKVEMLSMGYTSSTLCPAMTSWKTSNGFSFPVMENCPNDVAYYGGMGMPTIVVVGCSSHKVYYNKKGHTASDDAAITNAIKLALSECSSTGVAENATEINSISVYPNPAVSITQIDYTLKETKDVKIEVYNAIGIKIQTIISEKQSAGDYKYAFNSTELNSGIYFIKLIAGEASKTITLSVVN